MTKNEYLTLVNEGIKKVNDFNITTIKKAEHKTKLYELKQLYNELMPINRWLFDAENTFEWRQYKLNVEIGKKKKELDQNLRYCIIVISSELRKIRRDIDFIEGFDDVTYRANI